MSAIHSRCKKKKKLDDAGTAKIILGAGAGVLLGSLIWTMIATEEEEGPIMRVGGMKVTPPVVTPTGVSLGGSF